MKRFFAIAWLAIAPMIFDECERSRMPAYPGGNGDFSAPAPVRPAPQMTPVAPPLTTTPPTPMPMIDDPEAKTERWNEYIQADNLAQAETICRDRATRYSEGGAVVRFAGVRKTSKNPKTRQYECLYETEVSTPSAPTTDRSNPR
jgi:hypothetical protein